MSKPKWPTNTDGSPKKMRELTDKQRADQVEFAVNTLRKEGLNINMASTDEVYKRGK